LKKLIARNASNKSRPTKAAKARLEEKMKIAATVMTVFAILCIILIFPPNKFADTIKQIIFSKDVLLTPAPIDLDENWTEITLVHPISALNSGACLKVDITASYCMASGNAYPAPPAIFQDGAIVAILVGHDRSEHYFKFNGGFGYSGGINGRIFLYLKGITKVPQGIEFIGIRIQSNFQLHNVDVIWMNSSS
jgi:hypothetical protein